VSVVRHYSDSAYTHVLKYFNSSGSAVQQPWNVTGDPPEKNDRARRAYEALLTVTARTPKDNEYEQFANEVRQLADDR